MDTEPDKKAVEDEVNELIDLMTLTEANSLNEQLKELEQLEQEKKQRTANNQQADKSPSSLLFSFVNSSTGKKSTENQSQSLFSGLGSIPKSTSNDLLGLDSLNPNMTSLNLKSFNDLLNNTSDEFEREWNSAFATSTASNDSNPLSPVKTDLTDNDFGFFQSALPQSSTMSDDLTSLLPSQLMQKSNQETQSKSQQTKSKANWLDLFAELDPLKNPDAIGKKDNIEDERNC